MSIDVHHLVKKFGTFQVLNDVSLNVKEGELVALLGPSGSGKTTLLRVIAGLEQADSGQVLIDGVEASSLNLRERKVGFVFQHYALFKHMTVFENVAFGLRVRPRDVRLSPMAISKRVISLLKLVHMEGFVDRYPSQLSGGQRQRVALARALAVEPKLLLLDEPFGALDAKVRKELRRWLRRLHDEMHITSIFVTHDQEEAMEVADRVVVMNHGRIEQVDTPEMVYHKPANGFVYDFLGNYNEFAGWRDEAGEVHLIEDDVLAPTSLQPEKKLPLVNKGWLARYPELTGVLRRFVRTTPAENKIIPLAAHKEVKTPATVTKRGTPVRVFARPHEMYISRMPQDDGQYIPVRVVHINPAGALSKLELERRNGVILQVEVPKSILDTMKISKQDTIYVRPKQYRVFE